MKYITDYIATNTDRAKLNFTPLFSTEANQYDLFKNKITLYTEDYNQSVELRGDIVKIDKDFYVLFDKNEDLEDFCNVAVTYAIDDGLGSALNKLKELLSVNNNNIDNYYALISDFKEQNFIESNVKEPIYLPTYVCNKIDFVATQYKNSERLKSLISSTLCKLESPFLEMYKIRNALDLETATGINLDLIGKIVGVGRRYCGNFLENLNFSIDKYKYSIRNIEEIVLTDDCMRKLIKVKIQKNVKEIVNYKELNEIITDFLEMDTFIEPCADYRIKVDVGNIDREKAKCLILLRAFLPLPPTIELMYIESMETVAEDSYSSALAPVQVSTEEVYNEPYIFVQDVDVAKNIDRWSHISTAEAIDEPYLYIDDKDKALNIERETQLYTTDKEQK